MIFPRKFNGALARDRYKPYKEIMTKFESYDDVVNLPMDRDWLSGGNILNEKKAVYLANLPFEKTLMAKFQNKREF